MNARWTLLLLTAFLLHPTLQAAEFDLVLRGGRVVDGSGKPALEADVAVHRGRIVGVGQITNKGKTEVNARGLIIAPGFIDVHTHAEEVLEQPRAENFARMGVTTVVLGNCGSSRLDLGKYFAELTRTNISVNVASLIGHGTVRQQVMGGSFRRPPTADELARMKELVERAMRDGALGISTGLIYLPGTFSATEELTELSKVVGAHGGLYASHLRSEGEKVFAAVDEAARIGRDGRVPVHISHIKIAARANWGKAAELLAHIQRLRGGGVAITHDQYLYTASSTSLSQIIPDAAREGDMEMFQKRLADPEQKAAILVQMKERLTRNGYTNCAHIVIAACKSYPTLAGLNVVEAARRQRQSDSLAAQFELVLEIEARGGATAVFHGMSEDDLRVFLADSRTMFASDSGVRRFGEGVPHPRGYGNNARVLASYVRELKLLTLEEAVRRMTALPAATFQIKERGLIREGFAADLVVFDPEKVRDNSTFEKPHAYATGFRHVFVNGVEMVREDSHTGAASGQVLRRAPR
ncbi:MAG: D-aminoacylase [Pedosphaera sp.]|nr:D-aminoacylase [Pedosphaera sp.]MST00961.1 D-aminoacylase [Pedosphaera sp.]